ncbi:hypothetical protein ARMGADRAFT_949670, partial [Armillaria gallica]
WCGGNICRLLQAVYLLSFICLLRVDEVLKIQVHDIKFDAEDDIEKTERVSITLPFRKTSQFGSEFLGAVVNFFFPC